MSRVFSEKSAEYSANAWETTPNVDLVPCLILFWLQCEEHNSVAQNQTQYMKAKTHYIKA